jgi:hypothetical protein
LLDSRFVRLKDEDRHMSTTATAAQARQALNEARPWIAPLFRLGYAAKGIAYLLIGVMAIMIATGQRSRPVDFGGVIVEVFRQPFGGLLLALLSLGFTGYGLWCLVQALADTEHKGTTFAGIVARVFYAGIGVFYLVLTVSALELLTGTGRVLQGDQPEREWTGLVLALPLGRWLVALAALAFIGFGVHEIHRAFAQSFQILKATETSGSTEDSLARRVGQVGITARAVVLAMIGVFLIQAAADYDPSRVRGLGGTLIAMRAQPYGPSVFGSGSSRPNRLRPLHAVHVLAPPNRSGLKLVDIASIDF